MHYIVYKITNTLSSKQYIGVHKTPNLDDGYMGSGLLIRKAIEKYGIENFSKEILFVADSAEEMFEKEKELIELHDPEYNLHEGGKGGWDYVNRNGLRYVLKDRRAMSLGGKKGIRKVHESYAQNPSHRENHRKSMIGKKNFFGKKHTEETKMKIGEANSKHMKGSGNSQYGTMWITNGVMSKKIRKEDEIPEGWMKGRKI